MLVFGEALGSGRTRRSHVVAVASLPANLLRCVRIHLQFFEMPETPVNNVHMWTSILYWSLEALHNFFVSFEVLLLHVRSSLHFATQRQLILDVSIVT